MSEPLRKYSVRTSDLYDEHILQAGELVYLAVDVDAALDARGRKWTSTKPSTAGWYWWRRVKYGAGAGRPVVVELVPTGKANYLVARGSVEIPANAISLDGQWSSEALEPPTGEEG